MKKLENYRRAALILIDIVLINSSYLLAFYFKFGKHTPEEYLTNYQKSFAIITVLYLCALSFFKLYKSLWVYASIDEFLIAIGGCIIGSILCIGYGKLVGQELPYGIGILAGLFAVMLIVGFRISFRVYRKLLIEKEYVLDKSNFQKVMIIGAGKCASMIIKEMKLHSEMMLNPEFAIDDNRMKVGHSISGIKVLGDRSKIIELAEAYEIDAIIIAIPTIDKANKEEIINLCKKTKCKLKIVPGMYELLAEKSTISQIRDVNVEDLLGRATVKLDLAGSSDYIKGRTILVTGGGGSIGSELCRQIAKYNPKKLLILDNYENNAYEIQNELKDQFPALKLKILIATVRDRNRMEKIFKQYRPDIVFHAAAHKHVPLMEDNPCEAVKNNVFGTLNVVECADQYGAKDFVLISTDKAVNPTNVMGATKRICEMLVQAMDQYSKTEFVAVRFGNVLESNGSVVPLFKKQIAQGGPVTVTNRNIIRFFMTIPEATQLVLQAVALAKGGEIFILDMGEPVRIYDLACDLIRLSGLELGKDIEIKFTGLRPGEKLYEEVLMDEEGIDGTTHEKIFVGRPLEIEYQSLRKRLSELREIADKNEAKKLVHKLKEIVPTYSERLSDEVATSKNEG
jgi:FlaA1/EpsC-like NDP-sugar epimerase